MCRTAGPGLPHTTLPLLEGLKKFIPLLLSLGHFFLAQRGNGTYGCGWLLKVISLLVLERDSRTQVSPGLSSGAWLLAPTLVLLLMARGSGASGP